VLHQQLRLQSQKEQRSQASKAAVEAPTSADRVQVVGDVHERQQSTTGTSQRQAEPVRLQRSQTSTRAAYGALSPDRFSDAIPCRSATSQLPGKMPAICACDSALDVTHMLCCKQGESGWLLRHNLLQSSLVGFARVQGLPVEQNVRKSFEDAQQKSKTLEPDAVLYFPERPLWVDLSVTEHRLHSTET